MAQGTGKRFIPNEWSWIGFLPELVEDVSQVTVSQIGEAIEMTEHISNLNASSQGNTVPTPDISTRFETTIAGTVQANFTAEFWRYDSRTKDLAWNTLSRGTQGTFLICRYGIEPGQKPAAGDDIEIWPIEVTSRTAGPITSGQAASFSLTASVPRAPGEDAVVVA